jgi:mannose-6-phosphate isomerase-like protein (cupin superfamily)
MSYPEPRYHGEGGEVSATYRPSDHEPELVYPPGSYTGATTVHYLATGASTDGQFGLYRWEMGGDPAGPFPHFHRSISESFYILSGTIRIFTGAEWVECNPGDFVYVPPGGLHGFRNESGKSASMLLHFAPGAPREEYFEGLLRLAEMTDAERAEFSRSHDNFRPGS